MTANELSDEGVLMFCATGHSIEYETSTETGSGAALPV